GDIGDAQMTEITHCLRQISRQYDGIWRMIDQRRQERRKDDPAWPDHVFLPLEQAGAVLVEWHRKNNPIQLTPATITGPATALAGFAAWRIGQGVYRFDTDLYENLIDTPINGQLPCDLLARLPEWCVYVETPGLTTPATDNSLILIHGAWAFIDRVAADMTDILTIMLHTDTSGRPPITHIPLVGSLDASIEHVRDNWRSAVQRGNADAVPLKGYAGAARSLLPKILSLLLFLCSEEPDISDRQHPGEQPGIPKPKRTKLGYRLFAADKPRLWNVGDSIGQTLRDSHISVGTGRTVTPHLRRAHWHGFWVGPKTGERVFRVKWMSPMVIGGG
ncbi:MAG: hypothetical protein PHY54_13520, partial [Methylococcales bacterium]|nr:hypothetical protein [Methylococcales bacterium]